MDENDKIDQLLEDARRLDKSGVKEVFTPHTPVTRANSLKGRTKELESLFNHLTTPGQHALIYGERGIGKSSLAEVASSRLADKLGLKRFIKQCSKSDNFSTIFEKPLLDVGVDVYKTSKIKSANGSIGISKLTASKETQSTWTGENELSANPSYIADKIADIKGLLVIDEFDSIQDENQKFKIAEVMKLLSDRKASFKILVVGIAESSKELTSGHPSVSRCLREIKVHRMKIAALSAILSEGFRYLNLTTDKFVIPKIVLASTGYPFFTHLLGLKVAEKAILEDRSHITVKDLTDATINAIDDSGEYLKDMFEKAVDCINREKYERFLLCAAACRAEYFTNADIRKKYYEIYSENVKASYITPYLTKLSNESGDRIIRKLSRTIYRFSDPRMASFVKIHKAYLPETED